MGKKRVNNTEPKKLTLTKPQCKTIRDWFMFVDTTQRTLVDKRFNQKITDAILAMEDQPSQFNCVFLNVREAQMSARWWHMIPKNIQDDTDRKIYKYLETFIKKEGRDV